MSSQFLAPALQEGDEEVEQTLRPRRLADFVGQERTKEQLEIALEATKARGDALDKQPLAEHVEFGQRFTPQITRGPRHQPLELHPAESISHGRLDDPNHLADPRLPAPDAVAGMSCRSEPVHERAIEIEERPNLRAWRARADLRDRIRGRRLRAHCAPAYLAAYRPRPVTSGRSSVLRMPGGAATTSGMAFTIRPAAARMAA